MKKIFAMLLIVVMALSLCACNKQIIDLTYNYDRAIIYLPNGEIIEGSVDGWTDFEDGDQIQVKIDGKTYLVHSTNVVLIDD